MSPGHTNEAREAARPIAQPTTGSPRLQRNQNGRPSTSTTTRNAPDRAPEGAPCASEAGGAVLTSRWRLQRAYMEAQSKKASSRELAQVLEFVGGGTRTRT